MTAEERLERLEKEMTEVRWRLGLGAPPPQLNGVAVGTAGEVLQPDQLPSPATAQQQELLNKIAIAQQTPPLSSAEACEKYKDEPTIAAFFPNSAGLVDHRDYTRVQFPRGWQKVPIRFKPQLQGIAEVVPATMESKGDQP
jgi:hypothetical protein